MKLVDQRLALGFVQLQERLATGLVERSHRGEVPLLLVLGIDILEHRIDEGWYTCIDRAWGIGTRDHDVGHRADQAALRRTEEPGSRPGLLRSGKGIEYGQQGGRGDRS